MSQPIRVVIAVACVGLVLAGLAAILASAAEAQSALVSPVALRVTVTRERAQLEVATDRVVQSGDAIRTNSSGRAFVMYRDGSTVLLDVDSELVIEFIGADDGGIVVRMRQTLGRAWYSVSRALSASGRYEVHSAAMASVIRAGSGSFVVVDANGDTTIVATDGSVETDAGGIRVTLPAGTTTSVAVGSAPSSPAPGVAPTPTAQRTPTLTPSSTATPTPTPERPDGSAGGAAGGGAPSDSPSTAPQLAPTPESVPTPAVTTGPTPTPVPTATIAPTAVSPTPSPIGTPLPATSLLPTATPLPSTTSPTPQPLPSVLPSPTFTLPVPSTTSLPTASPTPTPPPTSQPLPSVLPSPSLPVTTPTLPPIPSLPSIP